MQDTFTTPMMKQYSDIKKQYADCLLFYRMGDFYELFLQDAYIGARILNITLTGKANGKGDRIPMAGVPYHSVDTYLAKLVKAGYKVAVCEQLSPPNKKGLVKRDVVRIVTPGTMLDEKALEKKEHNYLVSLTYDNKKVALALADISTGYFATTEIATVIKEQTIMDELTRIHPSECILPEELYNNPTFLQMLKKEKNMNIFPFAGWMIYASDARNVLLEHFGIATLGGFALEDKHLAQQTSAALLGYLQETQKGPVKHIKKIEIYASTDYLLLDRSTVTNLEIFSTIRDHDNKGTLLSVLDETVTPMGGRLLKEWLRKPLLDKQMIEKRHDAVSSFLEKQQQREKLLELLTEVTDIERLISRCSVGLGNARDLVNLKHSLVTVLQIKEALNGFESTLIKKLLGKIKDTTVIDNKLKNSSVQDTYGINDFISMIDAIIVPEPPISVREGNMIRQGIDNELDKLRKTVSGSRDWIIALEQEEKERTGINSLKVRFNQVFGFYIEVSKANVHLVPETYMRKQTLVNAERFITTELKQHEEIILSAEEKMHEIEYRIFQKTLQKILASVSVLQESAQCIAVVDCLLSFATLAEKKHYVKPEMTLTGEIKIKEGRHPVVETLLENTPFVPNDLFLDTEGQQLLVITGPNMAGKSVFIRQNALIVLMAQIGSFVPAQEARISLVDQLFVRSGASDVITSGLSTFMVEMVETAHILNNATSRSLIIMDEIGRGTSTYDGISIAWAVAEYLVSSNQKPKTLFATHYHELQTLEEKYPGHIRNYHMAVSEDRGEPVFLHTLMPGGASHSYGVAVAKLAGLPDAVINKASELLGELEKRAKTEKISDELVYTSKKINLADHLIHKELEQLDISRITPLEALNILAEIKEKVKLFAIQGKKRYLEAD